MEIESVLESKYSEHIIGLDIYEDRKSIKLSRVIIKPESRGLGIGTKVMDDLVEYADQTGKIVVLTPSSDFGGNKNRLVQFYKRFGFKQNKGYHKSFEYRDSMIRYPKQAFALNEVRKLIREEVEKVFLEESSNDGYEYVNNKTWAPTFMPTKEFEEKIKNPETRKEVVPKLIKWWNDLGPQNRFALFMGFNEIHSKDGFNYKDPDTLDLGEIALIYMSRNFIPLKEGKEVVNEFMGSFRSAEKKTRDKSRKLIKKAEEIYDEYSNPEKSKNLFQKMGLDFSKKKSEDDINSVRNWFVEWSKVLRKDNVTFQDLMNTLENLPEHIRKEIYPKFENILVYG